jgi:hypothetical protein
MKAIKSVNQQVRSCEKSSRRRQIPKWIKGAGTGFDRKFRWDPTFDEASLDSANAAEGE